MIKVAVRDFGPIIEGAVELKPLTIFVGPSNSGKSYMATLLYALTRSLSLRGRIPYDGFVTYEQLKLMRRAGRDALQNLPNKLELDEQVAHAIDNWAEEEAGDYLGPLVATLPDEVRSLVDREMERSLQSASSLLAKELQRCYGPVSDIRNRRSSGKTLQVTVERDEPLLRLSYLEDGDSLTASPESEWDVSETLVQPEMVATFDARTLRTSRELNQLEFLSLAVESAAETLFADFADACYYLPAGRSGVSQGYKAIASMLVRQSSLAGIRPQEIPTLPGVLTDFVGHMLTIDDKAALEQKAGPAHRHTRLKLDSDVVDHIERKVVRGRVYFDRSGDMPYPDIVYLPAADQTDAGAFPLRKASSMVSELAPVILFLKYLVYPGHLLILEEPESHLHPASQREMARAIVRLVNAGVNVVVTTHSDYFVGQINNLLKLSRASRQKRKKEGYEAADCLKPEDVSAYHFVPDEVAGGSRVEQLPIIPGYGIDEQGFAEVTEALYKETISLQRIRWTG